MMQVSAAVRLMPSPPARVDSRNTNMSGSVLKASMSSCGSLAAGSRDYQAPQEEDTRSAGGSRPKTSQRRSNASARSSRRMPCGWPRILDIAGHTCYDLEEQAEQ